MRKMGFLLCPMCMMAACSSGQVSSADADSAAEESRRQSLCEDLPPETTTDSGGQADTRRWPDFVLVNEPPAFAKLNPVTLDQGQSTTLDINPFISDHEDPDEALVLSWSADEVAVQDPGNHVLLVVAPTLWAGSETITLTVSDTEGLQASSDLKVIVNKVEVKPPPDPEDCGKVTFKYKPEHVPKEVLLAGSFNNWGNPPGEFDVMLDPDSDGTWEVMLVLEAGTWEYKFKVDGQWLPDPANPNKVSDGYGDFNSVLEVPPCQGGEP